MDYSFLRDQYPEVITMDQLYRICHISKRKARWLLENGVIPCEDSGKKTRRFKIKLGDVIEFLELRDAGLLNDVMPVGIFSSEKYNYPPRQPRTRLDNGALQAFILDYWVDVPDMLTVPQTVSLCGYSVTTIERWFQKKLLTGIRYRGMILISKEFISEWLTSDRGQSIQRQSVVHRELIENFKYKNRNRKQWHGFWLHVAVSLHPTYFKTSICPAESISSKLISSKSIVVRSLANLSSLCHRFRYCHHRGS